MNIIFLLLKIKKLVFEWHFMFAMNIQFQGYNIVHEIFV